MIAIAWSLGSLIVFRSAELHGPDMVGQEVSGFVVPLMIALVIAGVSFFVLRGSPSHKPTWWNNTPFATIVIGAAEVFLYCTVVVR